MTKNKTKKVCFGCGRKQKPTYCLQKVGEIYALGKLNRYKGFGVRIKCYLCKECRVRVSDYIGNDCGITGRIICFIDTAKKTNNKHYLAYTQKYWISLCNTKSIFDLFNNPHKNTGLIRIPFENRRYY